MLLRHLSLANFRNYSALELDLASPLALFHGENGQGKSNLLEAVYFLATTRPLRGTDRDLIRWGALQEPIPFARIVGALAKRSGDLTVEIVIRADRTGRAGAGLDESGSPELSKRIKVNGVARRALDLIGQVNVVIFSPQDLELIAGAPSLRRRYLDIAICQVSPRYCRALQQYNRIVLQRNHLLKQIRDGKEPRETLEFWSEELAKSGAYLLAHRLSTVAALNARIDGYHRKLTGTGKRLQVVYRSSVAETTGQAIHDPGRGAEGDTAVGETEVERQRELFMEGLRLLQRRELAQGVSLLGPHRDDLLFLADGIDMNLYGSRGQQRVVALALRLSEVQFMDAVAQEAPILLLDDAMSELDEPRRHLLVEALDGAGQVLITATDLHPFTQGFLSKAQLFRVEEGAVRQLG